MAILDFLFGKGGSDYTNQAAGLWDQLKGLAPEEQQFILGQYVEQGVLDPAMAEAVLQGENAFDSMQLDTEGKNAQLEALRQLQEIGNEDGLTASDKSKLQAIQNQEQTQARGAREAIIQNAASRGAGGSGLEMLAQLQNAQESATRASNRDLDVAAMAQERALQALQQAGQLGGSINQQQFNQQAQIANSQNAINQFNAQNRQQVNMANTAAKNQAQAANLQNKQEIANANVDQLTNQQQLNNAARQQSFQNQMGIATGKSNALTNQAKQAETDRGNNKTDIGDIFKTGLGVAKKVLSDENHKKDIEPFDAGKFLDSLTGYSYRYKDPGIDQGKQVGVMAQDLEKEAPQMVEDTPKGKMVDFSLEKSGGPIFAGLSDIHERLKALEDR